MKTTVNAAGRPVLILHNDRCLWQRQTARALNWYSARGRVPMLVIYRPVTREYPGRWVARLWVTLPTPRPTRRVLLHDNLDALRDMLPVGLTLLVRAPQDPPEIKEVWL